MKTLAIVLGRLPDHRFRMTVKFLKQLGYKFNTDTKEWSKQIDEELIPEAIKQAQREKLNVYIKEEV